MHLFLFSYDFFYESALFRNDQYPELGTQTMVCKHSDFVDSKFRQWALKVVTSESSGANQSDFDPFFFDLIVTFPRSNDNHEAHVRCATKLGLDGSQSTKNIKSDITAYRESTYLTISDLNDNTVRATDANIIANLTIRNLIPLSAEYLRALDLASEDIPELLVYDNTSPIAFRAVLLWAIYMGNRLEYCVSTNSKDAVVNYPELCIPCTLHQEMRIGEAIFNKVQQETYTIWQKESKKIALQKMVELSKIINAALENMPDACYRSFDTNSMSYEVKVDASNKVEAFKLSGIRQRKVLNHRRQIIDCCFPDNHAAAQDRRASYTDLMDTFVSIRDKLRKDDDFTDEEIVLLQIEMDKFCTLFTTMFGTAAETNYIHLLESGDLTYYLKKYRNLHRHNTTCIEATVAYLRGFLLRKTQHWGNSGTGSNKRKFASAEALQKIMLRNAGRLIGRAHSKKSPGKTLNKVAAYVEKGKNILQNKRKREPSDKADKRQRGRPIKVMPAQQNQASIPSTPLDDVDVLKR